MGQEGDEVTSGDILFVEQLVMELASGLPALLVLVPRRPNSHSKHLLKPPIFGWGHGISDAPELLGFSESPHISLQRRDRVLEKVGLQ